MMDPMMQQAMAGMAAPGGGDPMAAGGPSDQDLLMMILELIASGQLQGPGVDAIAQFVGAGASGGGVPAGGAAAPMM